MSAGSGWAPGSRGEHFGFGVSYSVDGGTGPKGLMSLYQEVVEHHLDCTRPFER